MILKDAKYSKANVYADDTNFKIASNDKEKLVADVKAGLHNIAGSLRVNKLSPNPSKADYMIIGHPRRTKGTNPPMGLTLSKKEIKQVSCTKSLGVVVGDYQNWDDQFKAACFPQEAERHSSSV